MIKNFFKNHAMHKRIVPCFDYLFLFRPTLFFAVWVMICIGMYLAHLEIENYPQWILSVNLKTTLLFLSLSLISGSAFITNQLNDLESDKENNKLFLLNNFLDKMVAIRMYNISLILGFILLSFTNIYNLIVGVLLFIIWDVLYNKNKTNWRKHPFLGPLCNLIAGILLIVSGWLIVICNNSYFSPITSIFSVYFIIRILPYGICYLSIVLLTDIPDEKGDNKFGKKSFSIVYGRKITNGLSAVLVTCAFFCGIYLDDPLLSISTITSLPFFIYALLRNKDKDILRAIRYPIFVLNFFTATIYPYLFICIFIIFYISKYYYWHRFNLHYPTFLVNND